MTNIIFLIGAAWFVYFVIKAFKNHKTLVGVSHCVINKKEDYNSDYILTLKYKTNFKRDILIEEYVMELQNWSEWKIVRTSDGEKYETYYDRPGTLRHRIGMELLEVLKTSIVKDKANKKVQKYYENLVSEYDEALKKQFAVLEKKQEELNKARVSLEESKEAEVEVLAETKNRSK